MTTFKEIKEKYPKAFEEFWESRKNGINIFIDIRIFYSDIVDFFDKRGIRLSIQVIPAYTEGYYFESEIFIEDERSIELPNRSDRSESESAGLEKLFEILEERLNG